MHGSSVKLLFLVTPHLHLGSGPRPDGGLGFLGCSLHSVQEYDSCAVAQNMASL